MAKKQVLIQSKNELSTSSLFRINKPDHHNHHHSPISSSSTSSSPVLNQNTILDDTFNNISTTDVFMPMATDSSLPKPKILKSCIRCRKHKTKCDASEKTPNPCSSCAKKGIQCKIDYVLPPQRSDNLKNLVGQVDTIKHNYEALEDYYTKISQKLDIKIESFEEWKAQKSSMSTPCEDDQEDSEQKNSYNLIKLSDGSFISINLLDDKNLTVNNKIIAIDEFQGKLDKLCSRLSFLYQTATLNDHHPSLSTTSTTSSRQNSNLTSDLDSSTDDNSSIASPVSVLNNNINNINSYQEHDHQQESEFGHDFFEQVCQIGSGFLTFNGQNSVNDKLSAIQSNIKLQDADLTPENLNQISSDFKPSSTHENNNNRQWFDLDFNVEELYKNNKFLLILLVGFFYSDNQSTPTGQLNYNLFLSDYLNSYYQIIENQNKASNSSTYSSFLINSIPGYHLIFNKDQLKDLVDCEIFNSEVFLKKLIQLLFLNTLLYGIDEHFQNLKNFISFIEKNINSNRKKISFDKDSNLRFIDQYIKLFNSLKTQDDLLPSNLSSITGNFTNLLRQNMSFIQEQQHESLIQSSFNNTTHSITQMKDLFKKFVYQWAQYFQSFAQQSQEQSQGLFIDNLIIETFIINCLIFINEGQQEFNSILMEFLSNFTLQNTNMIELIDFFKKSDSNYQYDVNFSIDGFACEEFSKIIMNLVMNKKNHIDLKINDIQVILENVDWKKESTDDVLKKIGVI